MKKLCPKCNQEKSAEEFYFTAKGKIYTYCKPCYLLRQNTKRIKKNKKPERIELREKGLKRCPGCKEIKLFSDFFYEKNLGRCKKCRKEMSNEYNRRKSEKRPKKEYDLLKEKHLKRCNICKNIKSLADFYQRAIDNHLDRYWHSCKECAKKKNIELRKKYLESCLERSRDFYRKNKEALKIKAKKRRASLRDSLDDRYILKLINNKSLQALKLSEVPGNYIDTYRQQVMLKRLINQRRSEWTTL